MKIFTHVFFCHFFLFYRFFKKTSLVFSLIIISKSKMIISLSTKSILRFQYEAAQASRLLTSNYFSYVKMKDLNEIKDKHKQQGFLKVLSNSCGFFMKQAWVDFKSDYQTFKQIKSIPEQQRTPEEKIEYRKIKIDIIKFGPAFVIFNIPFGFPLFYLYLTLFPQLIPSWMMVDSIHQKTLQKRQLRRAQAWEYYASKFDSQVRMAYLKEAIFKQNQSLQDLRRISCLCYNDYIDGTEYFSMKLGLKLSNGLIFPKVSLFMLRKYLQNELNHDYQIASQLQGLQSFEEKLFFKLQTQIQKNFQ